MEFNRVHNGDRDMNVLPAMTYMGQSDRALIRAAFVDIVVRDERYNIRRDLMHGCKWIPQGPNQTEHVQHVLFENDGLEAPGNNRGELLSAYRQSAFRVGLPRPGSQL